MKLLLTFLAIVLATLAEQYTDKYDEINVDEIVTNKRLLNSYAKCILDKGPCTPEGKALKEHIPDGLQTACAKCTDTQKDKSRKIFKFLRDNEGKVFEEIIKKYDPEDKYRKIYEPFIDSE